MIQLTTLLLWLPAMSPASLPARFSMTADSGLEGRRGGGLRLPWLAARRYTPRRVITASSCDGTSASTSRIFQMIGNRRMNRRSLFLSALLLFGSPMLASAQDAGLYDAPPPPDSAFVRIIRAAGSETTAQIGATTITLQSAISPYAVVKGGEVGLTLGTGTYSVMLEKARFYTVALADGVEPVIFEDAPIDNPAKSAVYLYNLGSGDASLVAPKQNAEVIGVTASGKSGHRMINAVTLDLDVVANGKATTVKDVVLERRNGTSLVVLPDGSVQIAQNSMAR